MILMDKALNTINAYPPQGITGKGICVAFLDTGICPLADFIYPNNRIIAFHDFVNGLREPYDDNGHGTHVCGIAASNGILSNGKYRGVAPQCNIVSLKILDDAGHGNAAAALEAINWIHRNYRKYGIHIVNMSIGTVDKSISASLLMACTALFNDGITVCAASGNENSSVITSPGISPNVITVGSWEEHRRFRINMGGKVYYKPDIFAPSENIVSCRSLSFSFDSPKREESLIVDSNYIRMSGTSMATPMVSGTCALILQKYPGYSPSQIKRAIIEASMNNNKYLLNIADIFHK
jgi:serine protease AprX